MNSIIIITKYSYLVVCIYNTSSYIIMHTSVHYIIEYAVLVLASTTRMDNTARMLIGRCRRSCASS